MTEQREHIACQIQRLVRLGKEVVEPELRAIITSICCPFLQVVELVIRIQLRLKQLHTHKCNNDKV
jgi:hypothetical protein